MSQWQNTEASKWRSILESGGQPGKNQLGELKSALKIEDTPLNEFMWEWSKVKEGVASKKAWHCQTSFLSRTFNYFSG